MENVFSVVEFTLDSAISMAIPLYVYLLIGEIFVQRSGCINMGIEGMMLMEHLLVSWGPYFMDGLLDSCFASSQGLSLGSLWLLCV